MTRDPLTDPQPGDVVRGHGRRGVDDYLVTKRDAECVTWFCDGETVTGTLGQWCMWHMYERAEVVDPVDSARLASEAAEAEVRALTEALEAARLRSLEAYAAWAVAVERGLGDVARALEVGR